MVAPSLVTLTPRKGDITFEEYLDLIQDGQKADLLDGVIYMASPDNTEAADLNAWLAAILRGYVDQRELGTIYVSRVAYRLGDKRGPEPDIGYVPKEMETKRHRGYIDGPPRLAIEIISPDSVQRDYIQKRALYEESGVLEYWILDPDETRATFLILKKGKYEEMQVKKDEFASVAVPGFRLKVSWLGMCDRPKVFDVLSQLLKKKPAAKKKHREG